MSIFSKIKGAKKAADKHKQAKATEIPVEVKAAPVPYRHIPTHAAVDALTGAPSSWREEDRAAIKHQHKRRSMMTRNSSTLSGTLHPSSSYAGSDFSNSHGMMPPAGNSRPSPTRLDTRRSYQGTGHYQPSPLASNGMYRLQKHGTVITDHLRLRRFPGGIRTLQLFIIISFQPHGPHGQHGHHLLPMDNAPRTTSRKLGEAPLYESPPERVVPVKPPVTAPTPVNAKKRSWGFMKRNSQGPAIAAH
ncbi:MAG: hypothetical protein Q9224_004153 [Gallowayella concinna]